MKQTFVMTIAVVLLAVVASLGVLIGAQVRSESSSKDEGGSRQDTEMQAGDYRVSGPFTHKNLTIFLIHGT